MPDLAIDMKRIATVEHDAEVGQVILTSHNGNDYKVMFAFVNDRKNMDKWTKILNHVAQKYQKEEELLASVAGQGSAQTGAAADLTNGEYEEADQSMMVEGSIAEEEDNDQEDEAVGEDEAASEFDDIAGGVATLAIAEGGEAEEEALTPTELAADELVETFVGECQAKGVGEVDPDVQAKLKEMMLDDWAKKGLGDDAVQKFCKGELNWYKNMPADMLSGAVAFLKCGEGELPDDLRMRDGLDAGRTALCKACLKGDLMTVDKILAADGTPEQVRMGPVLDLELNKMSDDFTFQCDKTLLFDVFECDDADAATKIAEKIIAIDTPDMSVMGPQIKGNLLMAAVASSKTAIAKMLLDIDSSKEFISATDHTGSTVLHKCAQNNNADIIKIVVGLDGGKELVAKPDQVGATALLICAYWGRDDAGIALVDADPSQAHLEAYSENFKCSAVSKAYGDLKVRITSALEAAGVGAAAAAEPGTAAAAAADTQAGMPSIVRQPSARPPAPKELTKSGFMNKGGHGLIDTGMKRRFFDLSKSAAGNYQLTYYTGEDKKSQKGIIMLKGATVGRTHAQLTVQENAEKSLGKLYKFDCEDRNEADRWADVLEEAASR